VLIAYTMDEEEAAAALAAVSLYLAAEQDAAPTATTPFDWRWQASQNLIVQGISAIRSPQSPTWGNIERLRRAGRGDTGITGL